MNAAMIVALAVGGLFWGTLLVVILVQRRTNRQRRVPPPRVRPSLTPAQRECVLAMRRQAVEELRSTGAPFQPSIQDLQDIKRRYPLPEDER